MVAQFDLKTRVVYDYNSTLQLKGEVVKVNDNGPRTTTYTVRVGKINYSGIPEYKLKIDKDGRTD